MSSSPPQPQNGTLLDSADTFGELTMRIQISGPLTHQLTFAEIERLTDSFMLMVKGGVVWPPATQS